MFDLSSNTPAYLIPCHKFGLYKVTQRKAAASSVANGISSSVGEAKQSHQIFTNFIGFIHPSNRDV